MLTQDSAKFRYQIETFPTIRDGAISPTMSARSLRPSSILIGRSAGFIRSVNGQFMDGTTPFRYIGASEALMARMFNLLGGGNEARIYVDTVLDEHVRIGSRVVRVWADPYYDAESILLYDMGA